MSHILIVGLGDLGAGLAQRLVAAGHRVSGIRRGTVAPSGVELYSQDLFTGVALLPPDPVDVLVIVLTPSEYSEAGYLNAFVRAPKTVLDGLAQQQPLPPVVFVSSSAVFGDVDGEVDEATPPRPSRYNGRVLLAAEEELSVRSHATMVRFSGIYGPGRRRLLDKAVAIARGEQPWPAPAWTNRIHRDDAVGVLNEVVEQWLAGHGAALPSLINGTDNASAVNIEVLAWLAREQGFEVSPPEGEASGKRLIGRFIERGGYHLKYPDYQAGYRDVLAKS